MLLLSLRFCRNAGITASNCSGATRELLTSNSSYSIELFFYSFLICAIMERTMTTSVSHGGYSEGGQDEIFVIFHFWIYDNHYYLWYLLPASIIKSRSIYCLKCGKRHPL